MRIPRSSFRHAPSAAFVFAAVAGVGSSSAIFAAVQFSSPLPVPRRAAALLLRSTTTRALSRVALERTQHARVVAVDEHPTGLSSTPPAGEAERASASHSRSAVKAAPACPAPSAAAAVITSRMSMQPRNAGGTHPAPVSAARPRPRPTPKPRTHAAPRIALDLRNNVSSSRREGLSRDVPTPTLTLDTALVAAHRVSLSPLAHREQSRGALVEQICALLQVALRDGTAASAPLCVRVDVAHALLWAAGAPPGYARPDSCDLPSSSDGDLKRVAEFLFELLDGAVQTLQATYEGSDGGEHGEIVVSLMSAIVMAARLTPSTITRRDKKLQDLFDAIGGTLPCMLDASLAADPRLASQEASWALEALAWYCEGTTDGKGGECAGPGASFYKHTAAFLEGIAGYLAMGAPRTWPRGPGGAESVAGPALLRPISSTSSNARLWCRQQWRVSKLRTLSIFLHLASDPAVPLASTLRAKLFHSFDDPKRLLSLRKCESPAFLGNSEITELLSILSSYSRASVPAPSVLATVVAALPSSESATRVRALQGHLSMLAWHACGQSTGLSMPVSLLSFFTRLLSDACLSGPKECRAFIPTALQCSTEPESSAWAVASLTRLALTILRSCAPRALERMPEAEAALCISVALELVEELWSGSIVISPSDRPLPAALRVLEAATVNPQRRLAAHVVLLELGVTVMDELELLGGTGDSGVVSAVDSVRVVKLLHNIRSSLRGHAGVPLLVLRENRLWPAGGIVEASALGAADVWECPLRLRLLRLAINVAAVNQPLDHVKMLQRSDAWAWEVMSFMRSFNPHGRGSPGRAPLQELVSVFSACARLASRVLPGLQKAAAKPSAAPAAHPSHAALWSETLSCLSLLALAAARCESAGPALSDVLPAVTLEAAAAAVDVQRALREACLAVSDRNDAGRAKDGPAVKRALALVHALCGDFAAAALSAAALRALPGAGLRVGEDAAATAAQRCDLAVPMALRWVDVAPVASPSTGHVGAAVSTIRPSPPLLDSVSWPPWYPAPEQTLRHLGIVARAA